MTRIKPGRTPDARAKHVREALRFCAAGIDEGWTAERTSELCRECYGVVIPPLVIQEVFRAIKKIGDIRAVDDSLVSSG